MKMLIKLFTSQTRIDILELFLFQPEIRYYGRQIAVKIKKNPRGVMRELENLEALGLLEREEDGNRVYFRVNKKSPIYRELKAIFIKTTRIQAAFRRE